jgi:hypothetical protein
VEPPFSLCTLFSVSFTGLGFRNSGQDAWHGSIPVSALLPAQDATPDPQGWVPFPLPHGVPVHSCKCHSGYSPACLGGQYVCLRAREQTTQGWRGPAASVVPPALEFVGESRAGWESPGTTPLHLGSGRFVCGGGDVDSKIRNLGVNSRVSCELPEPAGAPGETRVVLDIATFP